MRTLPTPDDTLVVCSKCRSEAVKKWGLRGSSQRWVCSSCNHNFTTEVLDTVVFDLKPERKKYVITWAQSCTPVNEKALGILKNYCKHNKADLVVIAGRYRNPTTAREQGQDWWDTSLVEYLNEKRFDTGKNLRVYADVRIVPTAANPLSGFEIFAGHASAILGHPKQHLQSIASSGRRSRLLMTTGAITEKNYSDSKAGKKAEPHHIFGGIVVEQFADLFNARHLHIKKDVLYDLDKKYTHKSVTKSRVEALVLGDIHAAKCSGKHLKPAQEIIKRLNPKHVVLHDLLDFDTRNHHRRRDLVDKIERASGLKNDRIEDEIKRTCEVAETLFPRDGVMVVVQSNHDDAFDRWLHECDPWSDPVNAPVFFEAWHKKAQAALDRKDFNVFEYFYKKHASKKALFLGRNDRYQVQGFTLNFHGDKGVNGSRGSVAQFAKLGTKVIHGHSHSPSRKDGAMCAGVTGPLDQGYNTLPSSWMHSHVVIYPNGTASHINVIEGRWS